MLLTVDLWDDVDGTIKVEVCLFHCVVYFLSGYFSLKGADYESIFRMKFIKLMIWCEYFFLISGLFLWGCVAGWLQV